MEIELWSIQRVKRYSNNPRINDPAVSSVAESLRDYGFRQPIVVDPDGVIVVGDTRFKAAVELGLDQVPVHVAHDLSPEQIKAYRIADNKLGELAEWDFEMLSIELDELRGMDVDLESLGFNDNELAKIFAGSDRQGLIDPDAVPAPPDAATTQPGDLWILGDHRLLCGDSSIAADVDRLLEGEVVHLVNTDPPYNVKVEPRSNNAIAAGLSSFRGTSSNQSRDVARDPSKREATTRKMRPKDRPLANDFVSEEEFERLLLAWFGNIARVLVPGGCFYIWGGFSNVENYPAALRASELRFSQAIIWVKGHPVLTRKDFMTNHEWCFYGWRKGAGHHWYGPTNATDVWDIKKVNPNQMVHLTEKPVELAARAIEYSSQPGQNVLDLFGGSGSTLIAAEQKHRRAFLLEMDALYCDVIVQRWENFTGKKAQRKSLAESAG